MVLTPDYNYRAALNIQTHIGECFFFPFFAKRFMYYALVEYFKSRAIENVTI